jgi:hypothetical protein
MSAAVQTSGRIDVTVVRMKVGLARISANASRTKFVMVQRAIDNPFGADFRLPQQ